MTGANTAGEIIGRDAQIAMQQIVQIGEVLDPERVGGIDAELNLKRLCVAGTDGAALRQTRSKTISAGLPGARRGRKKLIVTSGPYG